MSYPSHAIQPDPTLLQTTAWPLGLSIARGEQSGWSYMLKFGRHSDVDTGAAEDIWDGNSAWTPPTTARVHNIASSSANDTAAGTGARTITVIGLNGSFVVTTENITLNGISNVPTVNSYVIIYRMFVLTAGSGGTNAGNITATAQTDATLTAQISTGLNQTLMAIYQIPAGFTGYLARYYASMNNPVAAVSCDVKLLSKPLGGVFNTKHIIGLNSQGASFVDYKYDTIPLVLTEKT